MVDESASEMPAPSANPERLGRMSKSLDGTMYEPCLGQFREPDTLWPEKRTPTFFQKVPSLTRSSHFNLRMKGVRELRAQA